MTTTETSFIEATRRSQKAFLQVWTDTVPSVEEVVDHAFDYAEALLEVQRASVKSMLAANKSIASNTAWIAQGMDKGTTSKKS